MSSLSTHTQARRPLIGISIGRHTDRLGRTYVRLPESYGIAITAAGGAPVLIPPIEDRQALERIFSTLDGMLFPGGLDVHPSRFGEETHPTVNADEPLDALELQLAAWAAERELTTLGICRGQQLLNVALGGTLIQDLPTHGIAHPQSAAALRDELAHPINVQESSRLAAIFGSGEFSVNSFHHQSVKRPGRGLTPVAWSPDGVIEAVESTEHPWLLAVQFHPEDLTPAHEPSRRLFEAFVAACAERSRATVAIAT
ncbi:MAG: gamma-glutamyl-gamma-aminobutyrate hydrolase family protein [Chloroflexi bacterium]|nr:gamma-glutamyl-gamma-aminobutyrate hydrolase family protein [Chloroflexota bacterium]